MALTRNYYKVAARHAGVSEMWLEDAVQDMALTFWRRGGGDSKVAVRYAAIDGARRYGISKHGNDRNYAALDTAQYIEAPDPYAVVDKVIDFQAVWRRLRPTQRRVLLERVSGGHYSNGHQVRVAKARRRLRELSA